MTVLLLVGATGLVGQSVLRLALDDVRVTRVVAPTRKPLPAHAKLTNPVVDFDALPDDAPWWQVDAVVCALGTTIKQAGSQAAFRKVDLEYPQIVARRARQHGAQAYALTSSMGANAHQGRGGAGHRRLRISLRHHRAAVLHWRYALHVTAR